jgi:hypothetical protein
VLALGRSSIFLLGAAHHDLERIIGQRPLQRLRLIPRRARPNVALLVGRQDHGHRLGMDRRDNSVRRGRQEAIDKVRTRNRFGLGAAVALELGPEARECRERAIVMSANQATSFFFLISGFGAGASAKLLNGTRHGSRAQAIRANAATKCCECFCDGRTACARRWRHAPAHQRHLGPGLRVVDHGRWIIRSAGHLL